MCFRSFSSGGHSQMSLHPAHLPTGSSTQGGHLKTLSTESFEWNWSVQGPNKANPWILCIFLVNNKKKVGARITLPTYSSPLENGWKFQVRNFRGFPRGAYFFFMLLLLVSGRVNGVGISHRIHGIGIIYLPLPEKNQPNVKLSLCLLFFLDDL